MFKARLKSHKAFSADEFRLDVLSHYIREIYIIIVALGLVIFVSDSPFSDSFFGGLHYDLHNAIADVHKGVAGLHKGVATLSRNEVLNQHRGVPSLLLLISFVATYIFITYEWIAYNCLIKRFPYTVTDHLASLARFFVELCSLLLLSLIIYASTRQITLFNSLFTALLFLLWHSTIYAWYILVKTEQHREPPSEPWSHILMILFFASCATMLFVAMPCHFIDCALVRHLRWTDAETVISLHLFMYIMIAWHALARLRLFLAGIAR